MRQRMTIQQLILIERDIEKQRTASPAFELFNKQKISTFYYENKTALASAQKKVNQLMERHLKKDSEGNWVEVKVNGKFVKWQALSDEDEVLYNKVYNDLMNTAVDVSC